MILSPRIKRIGNALAITSGIIALALLIVTSPAFCLQAPVPDKDADPQEFVGTWHAEFKGKVFQTIILNNQDGKLTGNISRGEVQLNDNGELTGAEQTDGSDPIIEAKITEKTLHMVCKDEDGDTVQSEMKLTGVGRAELQLITPPHVGAPKPWKLERTNAKSTQK